MATKRTYEDLKAELAEANRTIRELETENEGLQDRIDQIAGIAVEEEDEDQGEEEGDTEGDDDDEDEADEDGGASDDDESYEVRGCSLQRWPTGFFLAGRAPRRRTKNGQQGRRGE